MELRYLGFDQLKSARAYRFDRINKGEPTRHFVITADLALFLSNRVGIQEGPGLCALKLSTELLESMGGDHELTNADVRAHATAKTAADARRAESRKFTPRRPTAPALARNSPWRGPRP
jgi:hypothetical protein